jgi:hypothetical protein
MVSESLAIAKAALLALHKPFRVASQKARIWLFQFRTRKAPFDEARAKQMAYSVLAGDIMSATAYRNMGSSHVFIACLRRSSESDNDPMVYVLEQIGETFKTVWRSERLYGLRPASLEVRDVDRDGNREVIFEDQSYGTGGGTRRLMVYSHGHTCLFTITESLNWQNRAGPISPEVEIEPASAPGMVRILEEVAGKHGFLRPGSLVDFDDADFAVQRWHKENGKKTSGQIRIHYYQGYPRYKASIAATLDTGIVLWLSFFKGPLSGYERLKDQHFIAYSPAWSYNWAKCLAFDGEILWFGSHCRNGLMSFRPADKVLESHESFQGRALPEVEKLEVQDGVLILNEALRIPVNELRKGPWPSAGVG